MGETDDITRLRDDIADLYEHCRAYEQRLARLEERSDNRDERIEELKEDISELRKAIKELEKILEGKLDTISDAVVALANAPSKKVASRWDDVKGYAIAAIVAAIMGYLISMMSGRTP